MSDKKGRPAARLPAGVSDSLGQEVLQRDRMLRTAVEVYRKYGFEPLETPVLEYLDALGKFLPDKDQPDDGVFALKDDDDRWIALRYDLTAPLARVVAQHRTDLPSPYRRYAFGPVFRRQKPGADSFRQFYQCDFDTVGSSSMAVDAEVCTILSEAIEALGIERGQYLVHVNNRKVLNAVLRQSGIQNVVGESGDVVDIEGGVLRAIDKLDKFGVAGVADLLGEGRLDESGDFTRGAGLSTSQIDGVLEFVAAGTGDRAEVLARLEALVEGEEIGREGIDELRQIDELLVSMGIGSDRVVFDPTVVRGLDYYTGPVFEATLEFEIEIDGIMKRVGSVAGGGRYDDLVKRFTGQEVPACGASLGVDRLLKALKYQNKLGSARSVGPVVVTVMDKKRVAEYQAIVTELRAANIAAEMYVGNKPIGGQLKYADKRRCPVAVIAGGDEFTSGTIVVKDLDLGRELATGISDRAEWLAAENIQQSIPRDRLVEAVEAVLQRSATDA